MATTSRPLVATISLSNFTAGTDFDPSGPIYNEVDIFDQLDRSRAEYSIDEGVSLADSASPQTTREDKTKHDSTVYWNRALSDTTSNLFPSLPPSTLYRSSSLLPAGLLPRWLASTSSKVTALSASRISLAAITRDTSMTNDEIEDSGMISRDNLQAGFGVLRVAVGCEDGGLWIFAPAADSFEEGQQENEEAGGSKRNPRSKRESLAFEAGLSPPRSVSTSPVLRSGSTSPPAAVSAAPRSFIRHGTNRRPSNAPLLSPSLSAISTNSATRISSMASVSSTSSSRPGHDATVLSTVRSRKASATISISTNSPQMNWEQFNNDPDPVSPASSSNSTFPSIIGKSFKLPESPVGRTSTSHHRHSKGKESMTSGIWEHQIEHHPSLVYDELVSPTLAENSDTREWIPIVRKDQELHRLEPTIKIHLAGAGELVETRFVDGLRFGRGEGGKVLVSLRRSGYGFLSLAREDNLYLRNLVADNFRFIL